MKYHQPANIRSRDVLKEPHSDEDMFLSLSLKSADIKPDTNHFGNKQEAEQFMIEDVLKPHGLMDQILKVKCVSAKSLWIYLNFKSMKVSSVY